MKKDRILKEAREALGHEPSASELLEFLLDEDGWYSLQTKEYIQKTFPDGSYVQRYHSGDEYWHDKYGKFHRVDGPAGTLADGSEYWWLHGKLHRKDGPAIKYADGREEWWFNGKSFESLSIKA